MELIFATQNKNKIVEIEAALGKDFKIISLADIGFWEELPETQMTFEGNALQKAHYITEKFQKPCFADDSGMEVMALEGRPGIFSARYAGEGKDMNANIDKILQEMMGMEHREAQFRTVIALNINSKSHIFEGIVRGRIIQERRGTLGFGYDPIFIPEGQTRTFGEMTLGEKNKISHRAIAIREMKTFLLSSAFIS